MIAPACCVAAVILVLLLVSNGGLANRVSNAEAEIKRLESLLARHGCPPSPNPFRPNNKF